MRGLRLVAASAECSLTFDDRTDSQVKIVKAELAMKVDEDFKDQTIDEIAEGELSVSSASVIVCES